MPLSPPKGPYAISTLTLEVPARQSLAASRFRRRSASGSSDESKDPFRLQTVLVTLFYPTSSLQPQKQDGPGAVQTTPPLGKSLSWLNEPRLKAIQGLLKYGNLSRYLAYPAVFVLPFQTKLPYGSDGALAVNAPSSLQSISSNSSHDNNSAPLSTPSSSSQGLFPVGVFSHGLAGSRTTYSAYLADLASEGMVVASVEHRDGSSPYTQVRRRASPTDTTILEEDQVYTKLDELDVVDGAEATVWDMRAAQLALRQAEVMEVVRLLHDLNDGHGDTLAEQSTRTVAHREQARLADWKGRLDMANIWALGHSFGGATSIELLRNESSPFTHAVVLDPWLEPIAKAGETTTPIKRPLYVINSEAFTIWRKHFAWLRALVAEARRETGKSWLMSITKTKHTDFSDFPFVMPRFFKPTSGRTPADVLSVFSRASRRAFFGEDVTAALAPSSLGMPVRDERPGEVEARDLGDSGHVVCHPLDGPPPTSTSPPSPKL